ncbi:MAG: hypothetical protein KAI47_09345 [Deltaproteobacteria bacterium]|nr:hypothetical protein [Deltaproteobacteria bacterium]
MLTRIHRGPQHRVALIVAVTLLTGTSVFASACDSTPSRNHTDGAKNTDGAKKVTDGKTPTTDVLLFDERGVPIPEKCAPDCQGKPCDADDGCGDQCRDFCATSVAASWSKRLGGTEDDFIWGVSPDSKGNVTLVGSFAKKVDFGGGTLSAAGWHDGFIASYDKNGKHRWSKRFGASGGETEVRNVTTDAQDHLFVTGTFAGTVDFGGGGLKSAGKDDIFVASYDENGKHLWSKRFGGAQRDSGVGIAVDPQGHVVFTGSFLGSVNLGKGSLAAIGPSANIVIASFDTSGAIRWSKAFGGTNKAFAPAIAVDPSGNVALTGGFVGSVDLGGGPLKGANIPPGDTTDIFVASFTPDGAHRWSERFGDWDDDIGYGVTADGKGNVTITGYFQRSIDFGGGSLSSAGKADIFVASFGPKGSHRWSKGWGSKGWDYAFGLATDRDGNVFLTGGFHETIDWGGGPRTSLGNEDIFIASYGPAGSPRWSRSFGGISEDNGIRLAVDSHGVVTLIGRFRETADLGGTTLLSAGSIDAFALQLSPKP